MSSRSKGKIIVFGILFWYPLAGVTYQFLHYLIGLRRLGYDPYYVEDSGRWLYDPAIGDVSSDATPNIRAVAPILERHGFADRWAFRGYYPGGQCYGMTEAQILQLYREADGFLNVTGAQEIREEHMSVPCRVYVESDPVAMQVRVAKNDRSSIELLEAHTNYFSFGENLGAPGCAVPVERFEWLPTRQPVVLDLWKPVLSDHGAYTTVATWQNKGKDVEWNGKIYYWSKDREFIKILDLPSLTSAKFEVAVSSDEAADIFARNGWKTVDAVTISKDIERYRDYIRESYAEFTVAKDQYVSPHSGWFSDRSACYLAAGRPVINQETAFSRILPTGKGLFWFQTMADILAAVDTIESDYPTHRRAAIEIAEEYFAAEKVVGSLMQRAGL
jgi:hypothetical protein